MVKTFEAVYEDGVLRPLESLPLSNPQHVPVTTSETPAGEATSFFGSKTIEQLVAEQGIQAISDISILAGAIPDEDVDAFVADIYRDRLV